MMEENKVKGFWNDAATYGGLIGVIYVFVEAWVTILNISGALGFLLGTVSLVIFIGCLAFFTKKRAALYTKTGFSYGQGLGFIVAMMLFTGFIYGIYQYLLLNYITPETKEQMIKSQMAIMAQFGQNEVPINIGKLYSNPIFMAFIGVFAMVLEGGFLGLFVSAFTKKEANPFAGQQE